MKIAVNLGERSYNILIENKLYLFSQSFSELFSKGNVIIISDSNVSELYEAKVREQLQDKGFEVFTKEFAAGEEAKSFEVAREIYDYLFDIMADRKSIIVALGGGVTGDLAGYIAATYMRGIPFVQVPTSLLAQVDSSVGGKVAINHPKGKNMIGAFYQPAMVYTDISTLTTLPKEEFASGMAEVVKHGIIRDSKYFELIENNIDKINSLDYEIMAELVAGSCRIKADVVSKDEKESGLRAILNFGHTAAHAFEALTNYTGYRHGEAVAIGMIVACKLSEKICGFSGKHTARVEKILKALNLPIRFNNLDAEDIYTSMLSDKKTEQGLVRFVLAKEIGTVDIVPVTDKSLIIDAINSARG